MEKLKFIPSSYASLGKNKVINFKRATGTGNPCAFFHYLINAFQFVHQEE